MMKKNTSIYKYHRSIHIKNGKDIPDQLVNLLANQVLFHALQYNLFFLILIYHNHLDVQKKLITLMTGRPLWTIELWGKLNSMKSAENRKRTVKLHWATTWWSGVSISGIFERCRSELGILGTEMQIPQLLYIRHLNWKAQSKLCSPVDIEELQVYVSQNTVDAEITVA